MEGLLKKMCESQLPQVSLRKKTNKRKPPQILPRHRDKTAGDGTLSDVHFAKAVGGKHRHLFHTCPNTIPGDLAPPSLFGFYI